MRRSGNDNRVQNETRYIHAMFEQELAQHRLPQESFEVLVPYAGPFDGAVRWR